MSGHPASDVRIAVLVSRIRVEEKLLLTALEASGAQVQVCLLYTSPSPRDRQKSRMPSSA